MIATSCNVATYSPDYIITITVEIGSKNSAGNIYTYFEKLPNMVSLITKWMPPSNSHQKTSPGHISYVPY
jgi:hypothetical protein